MAITTAEIELQDRHTSTPPSLAEASERGSVAAVLEERSRDSSPPRGKPVEGMRFIASGCEEFSTSLRPLTLGLLSPSHSL